MSGRCTCDRPNGILELPDELLLYIVSAFSTIRSYETQKQAFRQKQSERERQRENHNRQTTLYTLCLTSWKLNRICTPILYSSFVSSSTLQGMVPLYLFHSTLLRRKALGAYLLYVENRLSDYLGNELSHVYSREHTEACFRTYWNMLAAIITQSPNIQHLCVISIEFAGTSLWEHVIDNPTLAVPSPTLRGLSKLRTLIIQTQAIHGSRSTSDVASFSRICSALSPIATLTLLRTTGNVDPSPSMPIRSGFKSLREVEITECELPLETVNSLLLTCDHLERFVCHWAFLNCNFHEPAELFSGLLRHKNTLQKLHLDLREVRYSSSGARNQIHSLRDFTRLQDLALCHLSLPDLYNLESGASEGAYPGTALILPENLESLTVLLDLRWIPEEDLTSQFLEPVYKESSLLLRLLKDRIFMHPGLRELMVRYKSSRADKKPTAHVYSFQGSQIHLRLMNED